PFTKILLFFFYLALSLLLRLQLPLVNVIKNIRKLKKPKTQETTPLLKSEERTTKNLKAETTPEQKTEEAKKKLKKSVKKTKRDHAESLMTELPFTNIETWNELDFTASESNAKKKKRKKRKLGGTRAVGVEEDDEDDDDEEKKKKKQGSNRPNYFISVPITNPEAVELLQKQILEKDPRLSKALIPVGTLHITLLVTYLGTQEQVELASSVLTSVEAPLKALLCGQRLLLFFSGVGLFKQGVAFARIAEGGGLNTLSLMAECVRTAFEERGIVAADEKEFKPHLTFLKLSRAPKLRKLGVRRLDPGLFSDLESRVFGEECVCRVDLCSMLGKKTEDGYYQKERSVVLSE
ncbi:hypothetical protein DNTS_035812, partial [Danionella cerebrum]